MGNTISSIGYWDEKFEIQDWESVLSDVQSIKQFKQAYNEIAISPILFQANFAYLPNTITKKIERINPYSYQHDLYEDTSTRRLTVKSRQIGFTTTLAFEQYHKGGYLIKGHECTFVHLVEENAYKYLSIMNKLNNNLPSDCLRLNFVKNNTKRIEIDNGTEFRIKSANAAEGARGFTTDVGLDEFALVHKSENLMAAAGSATVRGLNLDILSTPWGIKNDFYRLVKDTGFNTSKVYGSVLEYKRVEKEGRDLLRKGYFEAPTGQMAKDMMYDWIREKCIPIRIKDSKDFLKDYDRIRRNNISDYSIHIVPWYIVPDMDWPYIMSLNLPYDMLLQEYFLAFLDSAAAMLSLDEIKACVVPDMIMANVSDFSGYVDRCVYCGVDPSSGATNETAWMFGLEPLFNDKSVLLEPWRILRMHSTWDKRHKYTPHLADEIRIFKPCKVFMDATGYGQSVYEDLFNLYGVSKGILDPINLSGKAIYEPLSYNAISIVQSGLVMIPDDDRLIDQMFALEKTKTKTGKAHFTGKLRSADGQDDLWWAFALMTSIGSASRRGGYEMSDIDMGELEVEKDSDYIGTDKVKEMRYF